jgi:Fe-S cluster assembly ATPase SufC
VLLGGRIVRSGGKELAMELEEKGYGWLEQEHERSECKPDRAQPSREVAS